MVGRIKHERKESVWYYRLHLLEARDTWINYILMVWPFQVGWDFLIYLLHLLVIRIGHKSRVHCPTLDYDQTIDQILLQK